MMGTVEGRRRLSKSTTAGEGCQKINFCWFSNSCISDIKWESAGLKEIAPLVLFHKGCMPDMAENAHRSLLLQNFASPEPWELIVAIQCFSATKLKADPKSDSLPPSLGLSLQ